MNREQMLRKVIGIPAGFILLGMFLLSSCSRPSADSPSPASPHVGISQALSPRDSMRYQYFFHEAVRQQEQGKLAEAYDLLSHALTINPYAAEGYYLISS